jgi:hypothetical protein
MLAAQKREKTDLAGLVRRLVEERDQLSERFSALSRERAAAARQAAGAGVRVSTAED